MRTRSGKPSLVVLGAAIALTACGGGSDGNGNSSGDGSSAASSRYDGPTAPVHISAANADGVMAAVFSHLPDAVSGFGIIDAMPFLASNRSVAQHASNASTAKGDPRDKAIQKDCHRPGRGAASAPTLHRLGRTRHAEQFHAGTLPDRCLYGYRLSGPTLLRAEFWQSVRG